MPCCNNGGAHPTGVNNAGQLPGADCYPAGAGVRPAASAVAQQPWLHRRRCKRAADYNVYWGEGGVIDSVIDVTHNVVVPFSAPMGHATWGILNPSANDRHQPRWHARSAHQTWTSRCVEPIPHARRQASGSLRGGGTAALSNTAVPGPVGFFNGSRTRQRSHRGCGGRPGLHDLHRG